MMKSIYDIPCPTCGGKIVSTARMSDDTQAPTNCENNHTFMRSEAFAKVEASVEPKIKLEASSRLKGKVMARTSPVTLAADLGIREIKTLLLRLGYQIKTETKRAFYTTRFYKEVNDSRTHAYELVGWHGQGIYGRERTIFEFYDSDKGSRPVIGVGMITDDSLTPERQRLIADDIVRYIKKRS